MRRRRAPQEEGEGGFAQLLFRSEETAMVRHDVRRGQRGGRAARAAGAGAGVMALDAMASSGEPYLENVASHNGDSLVVTPTSDEEFIDFNDLDINPNRDIVDYDDYKAVYHYDSNGDVNGFEYYYNFDSTEEAEENINYLSEKYRDMEGIDYITTKGKQIKIVFKKDYCKKLKAPSMQTLSVMRGE